MSTITRFNLQELVKEYHLNTFVDTGAGTGAGCITASRFFNEVIGIEIDKETYDYAVNTNLIAAKQQGYPVDKIKLLNVSSLRALSEILTSIRGNTLFYLDARFPGFALGKPINFDEEITINVPLRRELQFLMSNKNLSKDFIIIGGLNLWESGPFQMGDFSARYEFQEESPQMEFTLLHRTHVLTRDWRDDGYLICTPKA